MDNWDDVKFVLALSRHGTMTAAAQALGTNVATVSRRIDRITERSSTPLVVKKDGAWTATSTAQGFVRAAEEFDARIRSEQNNAKDAAGQTDQIVRISALPFVHHAILIPALPDLRSARPSARVVLRNRIDSLGLGDTDIVIRFGRPDAGRLVARKVADMRFHMYRSSKQPPADGWVTLGEEYDQRSSSALGFESLDVEPSIRCDTFEHVLAVIKSTALPGILPDIVGRTAEGIVPHEAFPKGTQAEIWMAYHQSRRADIALRAAADWIVEAFAATIWSNIHDEVEIAAE